MKKNVPSKLYKYGFITETEYLKEILLIIKFIAAVHLILMIRSIVGQELLLEKRSRSSEMQKRSLKAY
jgi:hypothetical protein